VLRTRYQIRSDASDAAFVRWRGALGIDTEAIAFPQCSVLGLQGMRLPKSPQPSHYLEDNSTDPFSQVLIQHAASDCRRGFWSEAYIATHTLLLPIPASSNSRFVLFPCDEEEPHSLLSRSCRNQSRLLTRS